MRQLYVVTHPEATHHIDGLIGGWFDSALTTRGSRDARRIADALASLTDTAVFSSDLVRCRETAAPLAAQLCCDAVYLSALREKSYGAGEGRPDTWFRKRFTPPSADGDRLEHDEGMEAESIGDFARRVYAGMDNVVARSAEHRNIVVVTHGGTATVIVAHWLRLPVSSLAYARFRVSPGSITTLQEDDYFHNRTLVSLNETGHLTSGS